MSIQEENTAPPRPEGFRPLMLPSEFGFDAMIGGYEVAVRDGHLLAGFEVQEKHCNHAGTCHGGMIATVFDGYLALAAMFSNELQVPIMPTMSLTVDFMAPAPRGAWVTFSAEILRLTRTVAFIQGRAEIEGQPIARASGLYRRLPADPDGFDTGALLRAFLAGPVEATAP